ncbi:MAG: hypothetical protein ACLR8Y_11015 [Alistipes indistinctus]
MVKSLTVTPLLLGAADGHLRAVRLKRCGELGKVGPVVEDVARKRQFPEAVSATLGIDLAVVFRGEREGEEFEPGRICLDDGFVIVLVVVLLLLVFTGSGFGGGLLDAGRKGLPATAGSVRMSSFDRMVFMVGRYR